MTSNQPIGIFDSGVGGLTVAKAIGDRLPHEQLIYVGDTQHMPYGDKSPEHIKAYCKRIVEFLISKNVKIIVIACNTASAIAASYLRSIFWQQVEIIGVIRPVIQSIIAKNIHKIGIIGTQGTIQSNIYPTLFKEYGSNIDVFQLATPLLAPMIEEGIYGNETSAAILHQYLQHPEFEDKEAILLACTHYPMIKNEVEFYFNHTKLILDNAIPMADIVYKFLETNQLFAEVKVNSNEFYVTDYTNSFEQISSVFYGQAIHIEQINIHNETNEL